MECGTVWFRNMDLEETLQAFEMGTWRRLEKVSSIKHKTNEEVLETIGEERSLIRTIKTRQRSESETLLEGNHC